jgi:hypothetical protein
MLAALSGLVAPVLLLAALQSAESAHATAAGVTAAVCLASAALLLFVTRPAQAGETVIPRSVGALLLFPAPLASAAAAMEAPLLTVTREYAGSPGPAVAAVVSGLDLLLRCVCGLVALASVFLFLTLGRRVGAWVVRGVPSPVLASAALVVGAGSVTLSGRTVWETRGVPASDVYLASLPVVAEAPKSDRYELDARSGEPRLIPRESDSATDYCRVGDVRQRSDEPCTGVVLKHDARRGAWLVEARTRRGLEPLLWCSGHPTECPDFLAPRQLATAVGPPRTWLATAIAGALLALLAATLGLGRHPSVRFATRVSLAAACVALTTAPLVVYRASFSGVSGDDGGSLR